MDWILMAPQYHFAMAVLVLICLALLVAIYVRMRFICQLIGTCPLCHRNTLYTTQRCLACHFHREHANELPQDRRAP
jgi:hypothetical protein